MDVGNVRLKDGPPPPGGNIAASVVAIVLVLATGNLVGAALVLVWRALTQTPWRDLGFVRPKNWIADIAFGVAGGLILKLFTKAVLLPSLGADPINHTYHFIVGDPFAYSRMLLFVIIGGGLGEELIWRGFLFDRSRALFGSSTSARVGTVIVTSVAFASAHLFDQGWAGAAQALVTGFAFGVAYLQLGRLWPVIAAHAAYDVAALVLIYWRLEVPVAHLFFR